ncbi:MAG: glucokinase [Desulfatiglandaceae bacterium]
MVEKTDSHTFLAGDIGGTKTNIGLFKAGGKRPRLKVFQTYPSREVEGLETILEDFVGRYAVRPAGAAFGIAGPVVSGRSRTTNLPWVVSEKEIRDRFGWEHVLLVNDLAATAQSIPYLSRKQVFSLNRARAEKQGNIGVVAPGTGLGEALLVFQGDRYVAVSSEGGHADFSPSTEDEVLLWRYLRERLGHVSVERVLSGQGLVNIFEWLRSTGRYREPEWLVENMKTMDPARAISEAALGNREPLCVHSLEKFVGILGGVCGNLALTATTRGGIYLGGGIPPKILPALEEDLFLRAFTNKGRFGKFLTKIPVRVILESRAALLGAAIMAEEMAI